MSGALIFTMGRSCKTISSAKNINSKDGSIYWSDASTVADIDNMLFELLGGPTGRLVKYDAKTKTNTVLISNLHFANGVQLSENEDFVLVTETVGARVMRLNKLWIL